MQRNRNRSGTSISTSPSNRSISEFPDDSTFTGSAVNLGAMTPSRPTEMSAQPFGDHTSTYQSLSSVSQTLSDKMRELTATAWTLEQGDEMTDKKRRKSSHILKQLEETLKQDEHLDRQGTEIDSADEQDVTHDHSPQSISIANDSDEDLWIDEADISRVRDSLASTVTSMRLRQQEQRHLHQLTIHKLEAVAQRCLIQERQMQNLFKEVQDLRAENRILGRENDRLRGAVDSLEFESSRKEVTVSAMATAVAGLEGWIDNAENERALSERQSPSRGSQRSRVVFRGKGRFRGKYYVPDRERGDSEYDKSQSSEAQELQDGIRSWIRGFRDVEDAAHSPRAAAGKETYQYRQSQLIDDDFGDFQGPDIVD